MVELVEYIAKNLVDEPQKVEITSVREDNFLRIILRVDQNDMGKIIGKQGKIAKSIRSILKAISLKEDIKVNLEIEEA